MNLTEAQSLAKAHLEAEFVLLRETMRETKFGFYFGFTTKRYLETNDIMDTPVGSCGLHVEKVTGEVHVLGSAFGLEYWLEAYNRGLHLPTDVVVRSVRDRQRAASALQRLQMTYLIVEVSYGETWTIPRHYNQKDFMKAFDCLPARFPHQNLIFRMYDLDAIACDTDISIVLEPSMDI